MFFRRQEGRIRFFKNKNFLVVLVFLFLFGLLVKAEDDSEDEPSVVINEVAWMGTTENYHHEWIELKNISGEDVDLEGWTLESKNGGIYNDKGKTKEEDEISKIILFGEMESERFYLLERTDDETVEDVDADLIFTGNINDTKEYLILKNKEGDVVSKIEADPDWPAGEKKKPKKTMERTKDGEWQDSFKEGGTPGEKNSEENEDEEGTGNDGKEDEDEGDEDDNDEDEIEEDEKEDENEEPEEGNGNQDKKELYKCNVENRPGLDEVYLNELLPDPSGDDLTKKKELEQIELYNPGSTEVNIGGCCLVDGRYDPEKNNSEKKCFFIKKDEKINSGEYKVFKRAEFGFDMNKNRETIFFLDEDGKEIDKIYYKSSEIDLSFALNFKGGWQWVEPTFGSINIFPPPKIYSKKVEMTEILPNPEGADGGKEWVELFNSDVENINLNDWYLLVKSIQKPNSKGKDFKLDGLEISSGQRLKIEIDLKSSFLRNSNGRLDLVDPNDDIVDTVGYTESAKENFSYSKKTNGKWRWTEFLTPGEINKFPVLKNYSKKVEMTEIMPNPEGVDKNKEWLELFNGDLLKIDLRGWYLVNQSDKKFKLDGFKIKPQERLKVEIKNSSFSIKNSSGWIELKNPNGEKVDKVVYLEKAKINTSYNKKSNGKWEWSVFITPGQENKFNNPPTYRVDIPDKIYENVKAFFEIEKVRDKDGEDLKFRWDFGDGKRSYLKETSHKFDKRDRYTIQTRVSDLSVDVFKYFNIEVQKFPEFDLEIVKLLPNPEGSDSEKEKVWILNKEKKAVNLKGWSITTGSSMSKLTNHYFREDFKIKAGDIEEIDRKDCPFSLLNKKGRVVLKAPNGDVIDKVKYEKDKIEDDEIYYLEDGNWFWQLPLKKVDQQVKSLEAVVLGKENETPRKDLVRLILDENKYDGSKKLVYFNNWLFAQSRNYFFEFIFPESLVRRIKS